MHSAAEMTRAAPHEGASIAASRAASGDWWTNGLAESNLLSAKRSSCAPILQFESLVMLSTDLPSVCDAFLTHWVAGCIAGIVCDLWRAQPLATF